MPVASFSERSERIVYTTDARPYRWGDVLSFGASGTAKPFQTRGWSAAPDPHSTWTDGKQAELRFRAPPPGADLLFSAVCSPFLHPPRVPFQVLSLYIDHFLIETWRIRSRAKISAVIPRELLILRAHKLCISLPAARSPREFGEGNTDQRELGVAFERISLSPIEPGHSFLVVDTNEID